eukprot:CAMPEP_0197395302 /NCGR_PEP_ID=MMETSP1165-20131217/6699_1 /TAXON_ID=284809 /ORGANISM="Chrysocystis fragilis, Strain CCMP3189" /LENGTH=200 /DNA_ID=CAMNT_0042921063 /DNA_START=22 /DNA_END=624 /DNA_ORIENTATION=+
MAERIVRVLDVSGSAKEVGVSSVGRVSALMEAVERAFGVSLSRQRLICGGRIMKADEPLSSYTLGTHSTVHLCPRSTDPPPTSSTEEPAPLTRRREDLVGLSLARDPALRFVDDDPLEQLERNYFDFQPTPLADIGTPREFVWGFLMGFVLGFIMLLYLWERSVSHRQKMGILAGATAQLFVKYIHSAAVAASSGDPPHP